MRNALIFTASALALATAAHANGAHGTVIQSDAGQAATANQKLGTDDATVPETGSGDRSTIDN
jgi:hypothetical protein